MKPSFNEGQFRQAAAMVASAAVAQADPVVLLQARDAGVVGVWTGPGQPDLDPAFVGVRAPRRGDGGDDLLNRSLGRLTKALARRRNRRADWAEALPGLVELNAASRFISTIAELREQGEPEIVLSLEGLRVMGCGEDERLFDRRSAGFRVALEGLSSDWAHAIGESGIRIMSAWAAACESGSGASDINPWAGRTRRFA